MARTRALAMLALVTLLSGTTLPAVAAEAPGAESRPAVAKKSRHVVHRDPDVSAREPERMRGQYEWLGSATVPAGFPTTGVYYRDQVAWKRIEPSPGVYDFSTVDEGIARARDLGGRFGFRVMAWCPGCWIDATPDWLPRQPGADIPAWDDETFLSAWERLVDELGKRYAGEPALGWVDVGGYGAWGEWHNNHQGGEITVPNAVRVMQAVLSASRPST